MTTTIVHDPDSGCADCPFFTDEMGPWCAAEGREVRESAVYGDVVHERLCTDPVAPSWCPLRSGPVTVRAPETSGIEAGSEWRHRGASAVVRIESVGNGFVRVRNGSQVESIEAVLFRRRFERVTVRAPEGRT